MTSSLTKAQKQIVRSAPEYEGMRKTIVSASKKRKEIQESCENVSRSDELIGKIKELLGKILKKQKDDGYTQRNFVVAAIQINKELKLEGESKVDNIYLNSISQSVNTEINKGMWSPEECSLFDAALKEGYGTAYISRVILKGTRTPAQCSQHLRSIQRKGAYDWTTEKLEILTEAFKKYSESKADVFSYIAKKVFDEEVTGDQVAYQVGLLKKLAYNKKWLKAENEKLLKAVGKHSKNWAIISREVFKGKRSAEQCNRHYCNMIARNIRRYQKTLRSKLALQRKLLNDLNGSPQAFFAAFSAG